METGQIIMLVICGLVLLGICIKHRFMPSIPEPEPKPILVEVKAVHYSPYVSGFMSDQSAFYDIIARDAEGRTFRDQRRDPMVVGDMVNIYQYKDFDCWVQTHE